MSKFGTKAIHAGTEPDSATGAIMTVKLMEEMEYRDINLGLATMCVGGGQGCATIFERLN